jgi:broad specificity phosphatase PhoE
VIRLVLVRHAPTAATRRATFPGDEPLDDAGRAAAQAALGTLPDADRVLSSPMRRCVETAAALGLAPTLDARLRECDFGAWTGLTYAEIAPDHLRRFEADPDAAPHGGESLGAFALRVAGWLAAGPDGTTVAVTHGGVIRAAVAHALGAPVLASQRIASSTLAFTELYGDDGAWTLTRHNCELVHA